MVLIILAVISINIVFGEEGIIERARQSQQHMANAQAEEQQLLADTTNAMEGYIAGEREEVTISKEEYETLLKRIENIEKKTNVLLERKQSAASTSLTVNTWAVLGRIPLSGYGTGKAIISFNIMNADTVTGKLTARLLTRQGNEEATEIGRDTTTGYDSKLNYAGATASATISYDENTVIDFQAFSDTALTPHFGYSILLIPD